MKVCPPQKRKKKKRMQASAKIKTETQINGCLHYAIPCAYFCVCCGCGCCAQACMKWCALSMKEGRWQLNCFCDEYWLHFPWTNNPRGVRGSLLFYCYFAFVLLWALHLLLCVCVPSVRGADTTDRSRRVCMRWSLVCRSCLLLPPPSVCWCCGRAVCVVCVPAAVDWSVCRAWCAVYGACLAAALSSCGVSSVCVSAAPLVSPVALHVPHCADQLHTTERPHSR
ncbi:hypothetical protein ECC02_005452 [Trypanosoma cruzi]|uniref:Mucin TcMUC n=1 Tax=Trypanosoma cruzi TaxID=5693 RepID=A0A7J6Y463_TRYCR|nr:hypothetical protein ECC02_005452 [Trypanosoma cruzi]